MIHPSGSTRLRIRQCLSRKMRIFLTVCDKSQRLPSSFGCVSAIPPAKRCFCGSCLCSHKSPPSSKKVNASSKSVSFDCCSNGGSHSLANRTGGTPRLPRQTGCLSSFIFSRTHASGCRGRPCLWLRRTFVSSCFSFCAGRTSFRAFDRIV